MKIKDFCFGFRLMLLIILTLFNSTNAQKSGLQHWKSKEILGAIGLVMALNDSLKTWQPFGTGVLVDIDSTFPHIFFITNRHIYMARDTFIIQLNTYMTNDTLTVFERKFINISKNMDAFVPQTNDSDFVAILVKRPKEEEFIAIGLSDFRFTPSFEYGENVEFYGYPLYSNFGLSRNNFQFPILRSGVTSFFANDASITGLLPSMFLVDGVSFGGGSGSPVFSKRIILTDSSTIAYERKFIGIISGHYPLWDEIEIKPKLSINKDVLADSIDVEELMTNYKFIYEQNSDLAIVISTDILVSYIRRNYLNYLINRLKIIQAKDSTKILTK